MKALLGYLLALVLSVKLLVALYSNVQAKEELTERKYEEFCQKFIKLISRCILIGETVERKDSRMDAYNVCSLKVKEEVRKEEVIAKLNAKTGNFLDEICLYYCVEANLGRFTSSKSAPILAKIEQICLSFVREFNMGGCKRP